MTKKKWIILIVSIIVILGVIMGILLPNFGCTTIFTQCNCAVEGECICPEPFTECGFGILLNNLFNL